MGVVKGFERKDVMYSLRNDIFNLIIFPTEECNFRCVYCYEDFEIGNMPHWVVDATKQLLTNKIKNLKYLSFSWFGGEPLVAKRILFEIAEHAYELCEKYNCQFLGELTTNGFMLDTGTLKRLVSLKQSRFQISIDGDQEVHDLTRVTKNGRGSFSRIWQRLLDASETNLAEGSPQIYTPYYQLFANLICAQSH